MTYLFSLGLFVLLFTFISIRFNDVEADHRSLKKKVQDNYKYPNLQSCVEEKLAVLLNALESLEKEYRELRNRITEIGKGQERMEHLERETEQLKRESDLLFRKVDHE